VRARERERERARERERESERMRERERTSERVSERAREAERERERDYWERNPPLECDDLPPSVHSLNFKWVGDNGRRHQTLRIECLSVSRKHNLKQLAFAWRCHWVHSPGIGV
jgi:hypothetical protein